MLLNGFTYLIVGAVLVENFQIYLHTAGDKYWNCKLIAWLQLLLNKSDDLISAVPSIPDIIIR